MDAETLHSRIRYERVLLGCQVRVMFRHLAVDLGLHDYHPRCTIDEAWL